jgi:hypothetical protein
MGVVKIEGGEITYNYLMQKNKHELARECLTLLEMLERFNKQPADLAKTLYYAYTDHDPYFHSNRSAPWEELRPQDQDQWEWVARKAIKSIKSNGSK